MWMQVEFQKNIMCYDFIDSGWEFPIQLVKQTDRTRLIHDTADPTDSGLIVMFTGTNIAWICDESQTNGKAKMRTAVYIVPSTICQKRKLVKKGLDTALVCSGLCSSGWESGDLFQI